MIITIIGTKRALSSIRKIFSYKVTTGNHHLRTTVLNDNICNVFRGSNLASSRSSSTTNISSKKLPKRRRRKKIDDHNQQQQQQNKKAIPKWPSVVSVLIVPVMFAAWGASDWFFGNKMKGYNEALRKKLVAAHQCHDDDDNDDNNDYYYLTVLESKPILFHCVIRRNTGFTHCLSGVQLGDLVEVLEVSIILFKKASGA